MNAWDIGGSGGGGQEEEGEVGMVVGDDDDEEEEEETSSSSSVETLVSLLKRVVVVVGGGLVGKTVAGVYTLFDTIQLGLEIAREDLTDPLANLTMAKEMVSTIVANEVVMRVLSAKQKESLKDSMVELERLLGLQVKEEGEVVVAGDHMVVEGVEKVLEDKLEAIIGHAPTKIAEIEEVRSRVEGYVK